MLPKFWWGSNDERRKIRWMSWVKLSKAKMDGGMGFRGMSEFNKTLPGKHCWRLVTGDASLLEKIFRSRYYPNGNFMNANEGYQLSYAWRSILSARDLVDKGGVWKIGNGRNVGIWKDKWMPEMRCIESRRSNCILFDDAYVSDLIDEDTKQWKRDLIFLCFESHVAQQILSTPLSFRMPSDALVWNWEKDGMYFIHSETMSYVTKRLDSNRVRLTLNETPCGGKFGEPQFRIKSRISCRDLQKISFQLESTFKRKVSLLTYFSLFSIERMNPHIICS
jgi:hypothetical protein